MLQDLIIGCEDDALPLPLTADALLEAAQVRWPDGVRVVDEDPRKIALRLDVVAEGPGFSVTATHALSSIDLDGTPEQNADVAVWLRTLMPANGPRIVAFDSGLTAEIELTPGMTVADFDREVRSALEG
ncbi:hypothetical protein [Cellulomonas sp. GbtcB1]|uniref:hypothetical protein n=1 Tax=Cellulomonas sp. GbtcB1 TaxID=2824746 RepID=UPI001C305103|nr:hypothetical protein [Cellulomonas sp. GbtcB1]